MVVNNIIPQITALGFSEYEAKAYVHLLSVQPASAYELSQASGIPSSKIYEILGRLVEKRVVFVEGEGRKKKYVGTPPEEFVESRRRFFHRTFDTLEEGLKQLTVKADDVSFIWNITEYDFLIDKAERMIEGASESLLLSTWPDEAGTLEPALSQAEARGVRIATVHFGEIKTAAGRIFEHPIEDTLFEEKGGRGFVLVTDATAAIVATITNTNRVEGAWSLNQGFITLAEDYIKHDIYIMKIVHRFDEKLHSTFGDRYHHLRDIFNDDDLT
ncbi:TrmB family transcriptional regulator [Desulfoluna spongiiphila]|uniref:TrmB family transcriptional regulator n=1 Tax=Desulfoluna spongiiphila TaxID=419481 RepID=UPI001255C5A7|nr:helix-turn-helix domain-containing protein [Desulfoluna spongiiphila]VVS91099.1 transcription regulator trmb c-terminal [Desulfoluna spongiiphila]